ncbi:monovalent cation/H(+) antiporter subunit G [Syntrophomonas wolfei]|uniref:monovalent cation/H(+) antiporter subunit G n=1 Tax=Syntrophomonas wolfei TaxID=863 RepID=UPI0023F0293B|nr:monovalent cation/H(+) antiporter subunit G [Syntrophomonas wolfei]
MVAFFLSSIGFISRPDIYNRARTLSKSSILSVLSVLLGLFFFFVIVAGYFS